MLNKLRMEDTWLICRNILNDRNKIFFLRHFCTNDAISASVVHEICTIYISQFGNYLYMI